MMARGRESQLVLRVAWALLLVLSTSPAFAETVVLDAVLRGAPPALAPEADYQVPAPSDANVFVFDLSAVSDPIVAATLVVVNPPGGFASPQRRETYAVYAVTDAVEYSDAGDGALLGAIEVDTSSPATLEIPLAAPILRVLERTDGQVALGGRLTTLKKLDGSERLFAGTGPGSGVSAPMLVLTTAPGAPAAAAATLHVDDDADEDEADGSAAAPFASLAVALDLAAPGDVVQVAAGAYPAPASLKADVALAGAGPEVSVVDGGLGCAAGAVLTGFSIRGAVICGAAAELSGNVFEAAGDAALVLLRSGAWVHGNEIRGTVLVASIAALLEDNEISAPEVAIQTEAPLGADGMATLRRNRVRGRLASPEPPLECPVSSSQHLTLASNLFLPPPDSDAPGQGGVRLLGCVTGDVLHNTFHGTNGIRVDSSAVIASNVLLNGTVGIQVENGATAEIRNNDVFGNRAGFIGASTDYVIIGDQTGSNGNISADPDFVDLFFEDFRLRPGSPALDAGSDVAGDVEGDEDLDGDPRVVGVVDMGAQEHQPDEELPLPPLPIDVDLLPGKAPNEFKFTKVAKGSGKVAVAILSDDALDAPGDVDVATLILDREPVLRCSDKDVDRDGRRDLVCSFPLRGISVAGWPFAVPPACVRGTTHRGRKLLGCDEVEIDP